MIFRKRISKTQSDGANEPAFNWEQENSILAVYGDLIENDDFNRMLGWRA
jgi:hypothetical protein